MKKKVKGLQIILWCLMFFYHQPAYSAIVHVSHFEQILKEIDPDTLVLVDIDQTLIESTLTVGSQSWNRHMKQWIDANMPNAELYGWITFWIARQVPVKAVESSIPSIIRELQPNHIVLGFTARGEANWNYAFVPGVDAFTQEQLQSVEIFLNHPPHFTDLVGVSNGIIFTSQQPKGPFLERLLRSVHPRPTKIVFVDDNIQQLHSVENALATSDVHDIVFVGCHYTYSEDTSLSSVQQIGLAQLHELLADDLSAGIEVSLDSLLWHFHTRIAPTYFKQVTALKPSVRIYQGMPWKL